MRLLGSTSASSSSSLSLVVSLVVHAAGIAAALAHMTGPHIAKANPPAGQIVRVELASRPPEPTPETPAPRPEQLRHPRGYQVLVAPADVPTTLPEISLVSPTREEDFSGRGQAGGTANGIGRLPLVTRRLTSGEPYDADLVDRRPYMLDPASLPIYPEELRSLALDGLVLVRFVLDTAGRIEPSTVHVVRSTNPAFTASVQAVLDGLRYSPAWMDGRKVRARVEQRFEFHLAR